jgi:hypothetical protein
MFAKQCAGPHLWVYGIMLIGPAHTEFSILRDLCMYACMHAYVRACVCVCVCVCGSLNPVGGGEGRRTFVMCALLPVPLCSWSGRVAFFTNAY